MQEKEGEGREAGARAHASPNRARACYRPRFSPTTFKIEDEHETSTITRRGEDNHEGKMDPPSGRLGEEEFPSRWSSSVADDSYQSSA